MSKGYWIVRVDVTNQEEFKQYAAANTDAFKKYGAMFLARAGQFTVPEGTTRARNTILEFPSYQASIDYWNSPEYQPALKLRLPTSNMDLVIIEGYDGSQPFLTGLQSCLLTARCPTRHSRGTAQKRAAPQFYVDAVEKLEIVKMTA
jgi:uncharacterized protein (DUF1330 family)